jgi:serine/threonine-protein kinase RsbW
MEKKVLIVEADESYRRLMREVLADRPYVTLTFTASKQEAADAINAAHTSFDLIIIDTHIRQKGWKGAVREVRRRSSLTDIIITGSLDNAEVEKHINNFGLAAFVKKPYNKEELSRKIDEILKSPHYRDEDLSRFHVEEIRPDWLELTASSDIECIERFRDLADLLYQSNLEAKARRSLIMAINELGQNAIEWGNRYDALKKIRLSYAVFEDRVMLKIEDEGEGFNFRHIEDPTRDPEGMIRRRQESGKRVGGYGIFLVKKLMDSVIYNEKGNIVIMTKMLGQD